MGRRNGKQTRKRGCSPSTSRSHHQWGLCRAPERQDLPGPPCPEPTGARLLTAQNPCAGLLRAAPAALQQSTSLAAGGHQAGARVSASVTVG